MGRVDGDGLVRHVSGAIRLGNAGTGGFSIPRTGGDDPFYGDN